jgi:hypothetical protein
MSLCSRICEIRALGFHIESFISSKIERGTTGEQTLTEAPQPVERAPAYGYITKAEDLDDDRDDRELVPA